MKKSLILLAIAICTAASAAGGLQLAQNGKALYTIVERADAARLEKASVKDLKWHLDKITGGDFKISSSAGSKRIFIGVKAPGDNEPMVKGERRLRSINGDIYIYGEATDSAAFGIYDLLEKYCGCRWFTVWGQSRIPANANLTLPELNDNKVPPFWRFETTSLIGIGGTPRVRDYLRRQRVHITAKKPGDGDDDYQLGYPLHTFCKYMPAGNVPPGKMVNNIGCPYEYFEDKKYFYTNPEWFTLDKSGKRVLHRQLCLSNKELRKEFLKNLEIVIAKEYKGGDALIAVDMNDRADYLCCCENCKALEKKYETPGGPLYDYLLELSRIFAKKYPRIVIRTLAYGCTLTPPNCVMPENIMLWYAPLGALDFFKNYENIETKRALELLQLHGSKSKALWKWMYISPYYRGTDSIVHFAGIKRLAVDMRLYHKHNVRAIMTEQGLFVNGFTNFQELRVYTLFRLKEDLKQDENAIIREYVDACYGKAADMIYDHFMELEDLNAKSRSIIKSNQIRPWYVDYITPERLLKWQKEFDKMEKLTADDPSALLHVKRARVSVDQATLGRWADIAEIDKSYTPEKFAEFRKNYLAYCRKIVDELYRDPTADRKQHRFWTNGAMNRFRNAVVPASPVKEVVKAIRPLPKQFAGIPAENIQRCPVYPAHRRRFNRNFNAKAPADSKAAFGFSLPAKAGRNMVYMIRSDYGGRFDAFKLSDIKKNPKGEYHYYYLGRKEKFGPSGGWFPLGNTIPAGVFEFSGFGKEVCTVDFYISVRYEGGRKIFIDELLIVKIPDDKK